MHSDSGRATFVRVMVTGNGAVEHGRRDGKPGVWIPGGRPAMLGWDEQMEWHDGHDISLRPFVGKGLRRFAPDQDAPSSYSSRLFRIRGRIKGTEVTDWAVHTTGRRDIAGGCAGVGRSLRVTWDLLVDADQRCTDNPKRFRF